MTTDPTPPSPPRRLRLRYPSSFPALLLVGFLIVAMPLIAGLVSNAIAIEKLAEQSRIAVVNAAAASREAQQLATDANAMERSARFYAATGDRSLMESWAQTHERFRKTLDAFAANNKSVEAYRTIEDIVRLDDALATTLTARSVGTDTIRMIERDLASLTRMTESLGALTRQAIDSETEVLQAAAVRSRKQVFWQLLAMVPAALLLIAGFTYLLARPIRDLDAVIHRLGEGKLAQRIRVAGPRDIERLGEQLDWLRQRLIVLEDQKTRFFQHVSHELKTPLTALTEGSALLSDQVVGPLNAEQREVARILKVNSLTLERLIQDLLAYSQTQSAQRLDRKVAFDSAPVSLKDVIHQVIDAQKLAIVAKGLIVRRECERVACMGDSGKVRIVVDNLLSNAIKYSPPEGEIIVRLGRFKDNAVIEVIDQGPGIPDEDRDRVFDPFYRGKAAAQSGEKGTGLGLAIVRDYVEMHGGSVKALASAGAHFRVILPQVVQGVA
ncbi:MAG: HAMP domain-containing histidine kinase [Betaproteobacteria bacterium]|nr:HAMP domain-containing histidine kinase [Betaproteobacteria bacterium]